MCTKYTNVTLAHISAFMKMKQCKNKQIKSLLQMKKYKKYIKKLLIHYITIVATFTTQKKLRKGG